MPASRNRPNEYQRAQLLFLLLLTTAFGFMIFLLIIFLMIHATAVPTVEVDSSSSHFVFNSTHIHWDITINLKNPSRIAAVKHTHVEASLCYDLAFGRVNLSLPSFVVKPKQKAVLQATFGSTSLKAKEHFRFTKGLWWSLMDGEPISVLVALKTHRWLGLGRIWVVAFDLDVVCDDLIFVDPTISPSPHDGGSSGGSDGGYWSVVHGNVSCSISSFFVYV